jgi:hypothetical protein
MTTAAEMLAQLSQSAQTAADALADLDADQEQPQGPQVLGQMDGGQVLQYEDGRREFRSPAYVTSDSAIIDRLLAGDPMQQIQRDRMNADVIGQNPVAARGIQMLRGVPFVGSYLDEAVGAVFGPQAGQAVNITDQAMTEARPGQSMALQLAGTAASVVPAVAAAAPSAGALAGQTRGARMLTTGLAGALGGGLEGAVYGAGQQQGQGRSMNAMQQGALGTVLGGAVGAATPFATDMITGILNRFRDAPEAVISEQLRISPNAARVIRQALDAGDMDQAIAVLGERSDAMLADAGQPMRELLDATAQSGGQAGTTVRQAVDSRVAARRDAFGQVLDEVLGTPEGRQTAQAAIRQGTQAARGDAYASAYGAAIDYASEAGQGLEGLLQRVPAAAWRRADALMALDGDRSLQRLIQIADDGTVTLTELPDVRQIDYLTRALGDVAETENARGGALGGTTQLGGATSRLQRSIRETLRGLVPEYGQALDTAADAIGRVRAVEAGYTLLNARTTREVAREALNGMSAAEREAARLGLRNYIEDTTGRVRAVVSDMGSDAEAARQAMQMFREMSSPAARENVRALLGTRDAMTLFRELDEMATTLELRAAISQNSRTAIRQSIQGSVRDIAQPGFVELLADGSPAQATRRFLQIFTGSSDEARALREAGVFNEIADILTRTDGEAARRALEITRDAIAGRAVSDPQARFVASTLARSVAIQADQAGMQALTER